MTRTVTQRAAAVGMKLTRPHKRVIDGELRVCVYVNGRRSTWRDMLADLNTHERLGLQTKTTET